MSAPIIAKIGSAIIKGATLGAKGKAAGIVTKGIAAATAAATVKQGIDVVRGGSPGPTQLGAAPEATILDAGSQGVAQNESRKRGLRSTILAGDNSGSPSAGGNTLLGGG